MIHIHVVRKSTPRFTRFPSLVLIKLVLAEMQRFKNIKLTKNCMASGRCVGQRPDGHIFLCKFWHFQMAVFHWKPAYLTPNLEILWISVNSFWLCESIVANPIIYRLVPRPSRFETRQLSYMCRRGERKAWNHIVLWILISLVYNAITIHLRRPWTSAFFRLASGTVGFSPRLKNSGHVITLLGRCGLQNTDHFGR